MMLSSRVVAALSLAAVLMMMLGELRLSRRHERELHQRGAREPPDDVYATMQWAYPAAFVVMAVEGAIAGGPPGFSALAGLCVLIAAKALKFWAMATLGVRWTFRVMVLPGVPLVSRGPYALVRHPNYAAVVGELAGMMLLVGARLTGLIVIALFGVLLRRRIRAEDRALRHPTCS